MMEPRPVHPYRPDAYAGLTGPRVAFDTADEWRHRNAHVEPRHPLFDVRIQRFFLRLPVLPWCADKEILRSPMQGRLPEAILRRPKSPVLGDPLATILGELQSNSFRDFPAAPECLRYVIQDRIPDLKTALENPYATDLRPINLNYWLCQNIR